MEVPLTKSLELEQDKISEFILSHREKLFYCYLIELYKI